jgi:hypothetical protein
MQEKKRRRTRLFMILNYFLFFAVNTYAAPARTEIPATRDIIPAEELPV